MVEKKNTLHCITFTLLLIGGLNWLLYGLFQWEIGSLFGGIQAPLSRVIYVLVGLSAIYELASHKKCCRACGEMKDSMTKKTGDGGDHAHT